MKCVYHAFKLWRKRGGYVFIRKSDFFKNIPHFGWCRDIFDGEHWQPDNPVRGWRVLFHMFVAKGKVKKGK